MPIDLPLLISLARARADNRPEIIRSVVSYIENILNESKTRVIDTVGPILQLPRLLQTSMSGDAGYISDIVLCLGKNKQTP